MDSNNPQHTTNNHQTSHSEHDAQQCQAKQAAITQIAGGIAHRMQNILSAIRLSAEIGIKKGNTQAETNLQEIIREVDKGYPILEQLAAIAEDPRQSSKLMDLRHFFIHNEHELQQTLGTQHQLKLEIPKAFFWTYIDPGLFKKLITSIIDNSKHAMQQAGTLTITLQHHQLQPNSPNPTPLKNHTHYIRIDLTDTGMGIDPKDCQHIFDPFYTTRDSNRHIGMGLTIVYCLAQQFNGWVELETERYKSTRLSLYLPYHEEEPQPTPTPNTINLTQQVKVTTRQTTHNTQTQKTTPTQNTSKYIKEATAKETRGSVLIVEDEDLLREVTHEFLLLDKYEVCSVPDSATAIQAWEDNQGQFSTLITDFLLPGMNGMELAHHLRQKKPNLKVIFSSAFTRSVLASKHQFPDTEIYISKPYTYNDIRQALQATQNTTQ